MPFARNAATTRPRSARRSAAPPKDWRVARGRRCSKALFGEGLDAKPAQPLVGALPATLVDDDEPDALGRREAGEERVVGCDDYIRLGDLVPVDLLQAAGEA